jgi:hypothetical protein
MTNGTFLTFGIVIFLGYTLFFLFLRADAGFRNERRAWLYYALAALAALMFIGKGIVGLLTLGILTEDIFYFVNAALQIYCIVLLLRQR